MIINYIAFFSLLAKENATFVSILNKNQAHAFTETLIIDISALSALNNDFISTAPIYSFIETNSALFQMVWFPFIFHHFYRLFGYISTILFNATIYFLFKVASQSSLTMANFYDRLHIESAIRRLTEPKQTGTNLGLNICFSLDTSYTNSTKIKAFKQFECLVEI